MRRRNWLFLIAAGLSIIGLIYAQKPFRQYPAIVNYARWTMDYPRSDRHFSAALRRLTRVHARSVEQPISLDDGDDVYNWPFLYGVEVGYWNLTDEECRKMRDFLLRGGFFMCDDF